MAELPTVSSLWIGGTLTWLEQLCLKSFVDKGHHTVLYTYEDVGGVPEGVEVRPGAEVISVDKMPTHGRTGSPALFSDLFRFHLMAARPGEIWIDADMYCWRPVDVRTPHIFGYETRNQLNGAILRLPQDSEALGQLLEFTSDEYSIPEFLPEEMQADYRARAEKGDPVHVAEMPWGIWGPLGVTHFLKKTGEARFARPEDVYYPIHFKDRQMFFRRPARVMRRLTDETMTIHMWARRVKRFAAKRHQGRAQADTFLGWALAEHGITPDAAIIADEPRQPYEPYERPERARGRVTLTELADHHQTDKGSKKHNYTQLYEMLFRPLKGRKIRLLEMGLQMGGPEHGTPPERETTDAPSVRMWLDYFDKAEIWGLDVSDFSWIDAERFNFIRCDMADRAAMREAAAAAPAMDVIIDDGSHASVQQQEAFLEFFPRLRSGGLYIIEDLQWQPPVYENATPDAVKTRDLFRGYLGAKRFSHPDEAIGAGLNALRDEIAGCFLFQHDYDPGGRDKVVVVHKA